MPYKLSTRKKKPKGHKGRFCAKNKNTGKLYCSTSKAGLKKMMKLHEAYKHMKKK